MGVEDTYEEVLSAPTCSIADENTPLLREVRQVNMEKNIGISQQTLVSTTGENGKAKRFPQYAATFASTLGALAAGMVVAWTFSAGEDGINLKSVYKMEISKSEFSWISSLAPLGAGIICIPIGILSDIVGRKTAMLLMVVPFTIGWCCIIFANSVALFCAGRFITGLSGGAFCVTVPMYAVEIGENEIRGRLGSYFQLLLTVGILLTYVLGSFLNVFVVSIISAIIPLIFFATFFFMPETPIYHLKKGNESAAKASLIRLRGLQYDVDNELQIHRESLEEAKRNKISVMVALKSKATVRALIIGYGLMLFQQFSGVNAVIFYVGTIFKKAGNLLGSNESSIVVGVMQVVAVFISTLVVDRLGRRILLLSSEVAMFATTLCLGIYFYLEGIGQNVSSIAWLPLLSMCIFIILFSLGFGPIPWMMMGEIFLPGIKGIAASSACLFNWLLAFIVTRFFPDLLVQLGYGVTFMLFSGICAVGIFFVYFLVPETKGKTLDEIQRELNL